MSWAEIAIILVVGMFVLGPERIPVAVKWVSSTLRSVRSMAAGAQEQLRGEFGPEIDELRRQIADLQSLKEIQELRSLRDLNPRSMITKNLLGEEFSGGVSGFLGLNGIKDALNATGSGAAPESPGEPPPGQAAAVPAVTVNQPGARPEPVHLVKDVPPATAEPVHVNDPNANAAAPVSFDVDAT
ncbi:Sec-independent protein translocase protein TatB [Nakamurella panacisegetis]|nr:Sec-independent protein translocase protein TatB [Nakamurella panacisegetis]